MENYQYTPLQPQFVGVNPTMASFPQMAQTPDLAAVPSFVYTGYNVPVTQMPAGQPDPLSNLLFLGTYGYVAAFDVSNGANAKPTEVWRTNLVGTGYYPVSIIYEMPDSLYCGTYGAIYKLNGRTGAVIWKASISKQPATLWLSGSKVLAGVGGYVYCVDCRTGATIWTANLKGTGFSSVTMLVVDNVVYAGSNGSVFAFALDTGATLWQDKLAGRGWGPVTLMFGSSSAGRPTIYVGLNSSITAFDATTRNKVATSVFSGFSSTLVAMSMHQGDVWATAGSELYRLDSHTLAIKLRNKLEGSGYGVGGSIILLSVNGREIALEAHNGYVIGVDLQSGQMLWKTTVSSMARMSTILEHKGVVYVSCCGTLHAIDPVSGRVTWTDSLKGLGYCNAGLASVFKTTNCHADQPFVSEHEIATAKRRA